MPFSSQNIRITLAFVVSLLLVVGAFFLSSLQKTSVADAASSEEILKAYASKDTDNDGLEDWKELLYGSDPTNAHSLDASLTDGEAVAQGLVEPKFVSGELPSISTEEGAGVDTASGTVTAQFARQFITNYISTRGSSAPGNAELQVFVTDAVRSLDAMAPLKNPYTLSQLVSGGTGSDAVQAYMEQIKTILVERVPGTASRIDELQYFSDGVLKGNVSAFSSVTKVGDVYLRVAERLMTLPVPPELRSAHLRVANAYALLGNVTKDMGKMNEDPLLALTGLRRYQDLSSETGNALLNLTKTIRANLDTP
jgi:hypothetical protein